MVEALKKTDKKFLIIAGCIILLPFLLIVFLALVQGCDSGKTTHDKYEQKMIEAAENYLTDKNKLPSEEAGMVIVELKKLVSEGYIKSPQKLLDDSTCKGEVSVRRNGSSIESNSGGFFNYIVDLTCKEYKTSHLADKIKEEVVTTESGLYKIGEEYIFKGDKVNNYITLYGNNYRIMGIDKNNIIKLIKNETETSRLWDNKFNIEVNKQVGKNIYKDSVILKYLLNDYENAKKFNKSTKKKIVAYDTCIGKRNINDISINKMLDCSEVLKNQVVSLMNVSDFAMASSDLDCNSIVSKSCKNYNYLSSFATSSWTPNSVSDNSYEAYYISSGLAYHKNLNVYNSYNIVIYIDGNETFIKGEGTSINPYVIE